MLTTPVRFGARRAGPWLGLAAAAVWVLTVALVDPNRPGRYPTCPFLAVTGHYCPGCGALRAVHALAHGDLGEALTRNPLLVLAVPLVAGLWVAWARRSVTGRPRAWLAPPWLLWSLLALVLAFWLLRNLPGFTFLGP